MRWLVLLLLAGCLPRLPDYDPADPDMDGDDYPASVDCNDVDDAIHPGADEICNDVDDDCDEDVDDDDSEVVGAPTWYLDQDDDDWGTEAATLVSCDAPDGYASQPGDCNDAADDVHPEAAETCNERDDDCDDLVDAEDDDIADAVTYYRDWDRDTWGTSATTLLSCDPVPGWVDRDGDCDDTVSTIYPGAPTTCAASDDDCDGNPDDGAQAWWYADLDHDGWGDDDDAVQSCDPVGDRIRNPGDCDDALPGVNPAAQEDCATLYDDDCDDDVDDPEAIGIATWYLDEDGDDYGVDDDTVLSCQEDVVGYAPVAGDCNDDDPDQNPLQGCGLPATAVLTPATTTASWLGESGSDYLGTAVAVADLDGDDVGDVAISAPQVTANRGAVYVFHGPISGHWDLSTDSADSRWEGGNLNDLAGAALANAGDYDDNGRDELIVGAYHRQVGDMGRAGTVYVLYGDLAAGDHDLEADASVTLRGSRINDLFGWAVAGDGDFDGDGTPDLLVGAPFQVGIGSPPGRAALFLGPPPATGDFDDADMKLLGVTDGDMAGYAVAFAGDVNDDGKDDLLIGAPGGEVGGEKRGIVYLVLGREVTTPLQLGLDEADLVWRGVDGGDQAGAALAPAGDVNDDGKDDYLVGAPEVDPAAGYNAGAVYLVLGEASPSGARTLDQADTVITGPSGGARLGAAVAGGVDLDADGVEDVVAGAPKADLDGYDEGVVYVLDGPYPAAIALDLDTPAAELDGADTSSEAGAALATGLAVGPGGAPALLVGAPDLDVDSTLNRGAVFLLVGE